MKIGQKQKIRLYKFVLKFIFRSKKADQLKKRNVKMVLKENRVLAKILELQLAMDPLLKFMYVCTYRSSTID